MKTFQRQWQKFSNIFTLSRRLMFLVAGLLILLGFSQAFLINIVAKVNIPQAIQEVMLAPTQIAPIEPLSSSTVEAPSIPSTTIESPDRSLLQDVVLRQVQSISLLMAGVTALIGIFGARWITQQVLLPVKRLSQMVKDIQVETLNRRLSLDGPSDEVKELADAFDHALDRLEQAFDQQGRFVADASHEMRTPLATIRTNLEVIQQDPNATLYDYKEMSVTLNRTVDRMERLSNDLLLLARGEQEVPKAPVNLEVFLTDVIQDYGQLAKENQVTINLNVHEETIVLADARLLARAISNIVDNGIRYNHSGGSVMVTVSEIANGVTIQVQDTGDGIPSDELPYIFDRFYRVEKSRTRNRGGAGLGLAICDYIIKLHGGHIQVTSTLGTGSTFMIWLPSTLSDFPNAQT
jgi:signal transduction histidine kinase